MVVLLVMGWLDDEDKESCLLSYYMGGAYVTTLFFSLYLPMVVGQEETIPIM